MKKIVVWTEGSFVIQRTGRVGHNTASYGITFEEETDISGLSMVGLKSLRDLLDEVIADDD